MVVKLDWDKDDNSVWRLHRVCPESRVNLCVRCAKIIRKTFIVHVHTAGASYIYGVLRAGATYERQGRCTLYSALADLK